MENNNCFDCLNHDKNNQILAENRGWYSPCKFGFKNENLVKIESCKKYKPNKGFQIGGYYTHMHFEADGDCLEWYIHSDGEFPNDNNHIVFHICDFKQIEEWVKFWGEYLRKKGLI